MSSPENSSAGSGQEYAEEQLAAYRELAKELLAEDHAAFNRSAGRTHETGGATPFTPEEGDNK